MSSPAFAAVVAYHWRRVLGPVTVKMGLVLAAIDLAAICLHPTNAHSVLAIAACPYVALWSAHLLTPVTAFERSLPLRPEALQRARLVAFLGASVALAGPGLAVEAVAASFGPDIPTKLDGRTMLALTAVVVAWPVTFIALHAPLTAARTGARLTAWIAIFVPYLIGSIAFVCLAPLRSSAIALVAALAAAPLACRCWSRSELDADAVARQALGTDVPGSTAGTGAGAIRMAGRLDRLPARTRWLLLSQLSLARLLLIAATWMWVGYAILLRGEWACVVFVIVALAQWKGLLLSGLDANLGIGRLIDRRTAYVAAMLPIVAPLLVASAIALALGERGIALLVGGVLAAGALLSLDWVSAAAAPGPRPPARTRWFANAVWTAVLIAYLAEPVTGAMHRWTGSPAIADAYIPTALGETMVAIAMTTAAIVALLVGRARSRRVEILPSALRIIT